MERYAALLVLGKLKLNTTVNYHIPTRLGRMLKTEWQVLIWMQRHWNSHGRLNLYYRSGNSSATSTKGEHTPTWLSQSSQQWVDSHTQGHVPGCSLLLYSSQPQKGDNTIVHQLWTQGCSHHGLLGSSDKGHRPLCTRTWINPTVGAQHQKAHASWVQFCREQCSWNLKKKKKPA